MSTTAQGKNRLRTGQLRLGDNLRLTQFDLTVFVVLLVLAVIIALTLLLNSDSSGGPQIVYFQRDASGREDLWIANATDPDGARRLTSATNPILDFDVSPDGTTVIFSQRDRESGRAELHLLDIRGKGITQITDCASQDADCTAPQYNPAGDVIVYERVELNSSLEVGVSPTRIWLLDLRDAQPTTYPLVENTQVIGHSPIWSGDGSRIAFFDNASGGVVIYNLEANIDAGENEVAFIPNITGITGSFSPDGNELVFPELVFEEGSLVRSHLQIANLETGFFRVLSDPGEQVEDQNTDWSPDGRYIAIGRRSAEEGTPTSTQIYVYDTIEESIDPLLVDPLYNHSFIKWSPDSQWLTMTRFQQFDQFGNFYNDGKLEVWTYNLETQKLTKIAENARLPQWVP